MELLAARELNVWLTPVWLVSVGVTAGTLLFALIVALGYGLSYVPGLNTLNNNKPVRLWTAVILGIGLTIAFIVYANNAAITTDGKNLSFTYNFLTALAIGPLFVGCALGLIALVSAKFRAEVFQAFGEGALNWLLTVQGCFICFAALGFLISLVSASTSFLIVVNPSDKLQSLMRLSDTLNQATYTVNVPQDNGEGTELKVRFLGNELRNIDFISNERLEVAAAKITNETQLIDVVSVPETSDQEWFPYINMRDMGPFKDREVESLWIRNLGDAEANVRLRITTQPPHPEVYIIPTSAIFTALVSFLYLLHRSAFPKISAVALSTFKTETAQPLFWLLVVVVGGFMIASIYIPYNTFGDDIKMLKDAGVTLILVSSILMSVWAASKSIAEEIEGRTALTVLSKPIGRREFIVGKFLGIGWSTAVYCIILSSIMLFCVSYKVVYDAREAAGEDATWKNCFVEMTSILPALYLAFLESIVFVAISVAISTRLPNMANLMICFAIYVLGHLTPLMVQSSVAVNAFEPVVFFGQLIATVVPVLDHFNVQAALVGNQTVPMQFLYWATVYCGCYGAGALFAALLMFEDRDLA